MDFLEDEKSNVTDMDVQSMNIDTSLESPNNNYEAFERIFMQIPGGLASSQNQEGLNIVTQHEDKNSLDTDMVLEHENSNVTDMDLKSMNIDTSLLSPSSSFEELERIVMYIPEGRSSAQDPKELNIFTQHGTSSKSGLNFKEQENRVNSLQEDSYYARQLERDANRYPLKKERDCQCNVGCHPPSWTKDRIDKVHRHSFLLKLDPKKAENKITKEIVIASYQDQTSVVCEVPMTDGHFLKKKAEDAIRYIDIEAQNVDLKVIDIFAYKQPSTRKIFMLVSNNRVEGLVVAEPVVEARRLAYENKCGFQELEQEILAVRVGINRIWVHVSRRRAKWATVLCDIVRNKFFPGETLQLSDIAFNIGSESVLSFAKKYMGNPQVPLYEGVAGMRAINMLESLSPKTSQSPEESNYPKKKKMKIV